MLTQAMKFAVLAIMAAPQIEGLKLQAMRSNLSGQRHEASSADTAAPQTADLKLRTSRIARSMRLMKFDRVATIVNEREDREDKRRQREAERRELVARVAEEDRQAGVRVLRKEQLEGVVTAQLNQWLLGTQIDSKKATQWDDDDVGDLARYLERIVAEKKKPGTEIDTYNISSASGAFANTVLKMYMKTRTSTSESNIHLYKCSNEDFNEALITVIPEINELTNALLVSFDQGLIQVTDDYGYDNGHGGHWG